MSPTLRRIAARAILAAGAAAIAILLVRSCEERASREVTILVDPAPLGESVRAVRVDVFDQGGARGNTERHFQPGERLEAVRLRTPPLGRGAEVVIEVERDTGAQRVHRALDAPPGSTVRIVLGAPPEP